MPSSAASHGRRAPAAARRPSGQTTTSAAAGPSGIDSGFVVSGSATGSAGGGTAPLAGRRASSSSSAAAATAEQRPPTTGVRSKQEDGSRAISRTTSVTRTRATRTTDPEENGALLAGMRSFSLPTSRRSGPPGGSRPLPRRDSSGSSGQHRSDTRGPKVLGEPLKVPHPDGGNMDLLEYAPCVCRPVGIAVVLPGSSGGFGPGIDSAHRGLPLSRQGSLASRGSLYARLGLELSTGMKFDWGNRQVGQGIGGGAVDTSGHHMAVLQMTWRGSEDGAKWPAGKLKHLDSLQAAVDDICTVVSWAVRRYGDLPVVLSGFSFGGPSVLAAARRLGPDRVKAVAVLSGSARGGERYQRRQIDTLGSVEDLLGQGVPILFVHGTRDTNVPAEVPIYLFQRGADNGREGMAPCTLAMLRGSAHQLDVARDVVYPLFRRFVRGTLLKAVEQKATGGPDSLDALAAGGARVVHLNFVAPEDRKRLRKDRVMDLDGLPVVELSHLKQKKTLGYSE